MGRTDYHEILDEAEHMERCVHETPNPSHVDRAVNTRR